MSLTLALIFLLSGTPSAPARTADSAFRQLAQEFVAEYLAANPVRATELGIHTHDARLPVLSRSGVRRRIVDLREWQARLLEIDRRGLIDDASFDHAVLEHAVRAELLELEEVRSWQHNPMLYVRVVAEGIAQLVDREFGTLCARTEALGSRLSAVGPLLTGARRNLRDVPAEWTDLAQRNADGAVEFLVDRLPQALHAQGFDDLPRATRKRFGKAQRKAVRAIEEFSAWLDRDLRPRSTGDFRLGPDVFRRKLAAEEHIDLSLDELDRLNRSAIRDYRNRVVGEAARFDPTLSVDEVMAQVADDHPSAEDLIATATRYVAEARDFVVENRILTLPTDRLPIVRPTPAYARTGFASMSTAGPFETEALEAYYNITNVDPRWPAEQQDQHLTYFNHAGLLGISVHEAMPGHFVQMLYQRELPTDVRKIFAPATLVEGWAHYVEQMMVDEGLGAGKPAVRLGQLRRALQRHARWYAGMALHTSDAGIEEVARNFAEIAWFAEFPAFRETLRGTYDPTYLYYALGRMQILELREDYRRYLEDRGRAFSLQEFHDRFLRLGLAIPLARRALMPDDEANSASR